MLGFGHVHINLAQRHHEHLNNVAVLESEKDELRQKWGAVSFESGSATKAQGKVFVRNVKQLESLKNENSADKLFTQKESKDALKDMNGGVYLSADVQAQGEIFAPKSIMSHLKIGTFSGKVEVCVWVGVCTCPR